MTYARERITTCLRIPAELHRELVEYADTNRKSINSVITDFLEAAVESKKQQSMARP